MNHPDELLLLQYRFDTLEGDEKTRVADHLRTCSDCTIRYAQLGKSVEKLTAWDAESELTEPLVERALARVRAKAADDLEQAGFGPPELAPPAVPQPVGPPPVAAPPPAPVGPAAAAEAAATAAVPPPPRRPIPPPRPEPEPEPAPSFPGFAAWLGFQNGAPTATWRFALTALMVLGLAGLGGGQLYWSAQKTELETQVSAPQQLAPGSRNSAQLTLRSVKTGEAVAGAEVKAELVAGARRWPLFTGKTDAQGRASAEFAVPEDAPDQAALEFTTRGLGETDVVTQAVAVRPELKLHLSTDKPLYQPGQTIHVRALALNGGTLTPAAGKALSLAVHDPKGNRLGLRELTLGKFGVGSFDFELADGIATGTYAVKAQLGAANEPVTTELKVEVQRYTLPKFSIALTPERDGYLAGETLKLRLLARTFFGKPVAKAAVRALLVRNNGVVLVQSTAETSGDGDAELSFALPPSLGAPGNPEPLRVQVEVKDAAGQQETKQWGTVVGRELLSLALIPAQGALAREVPNEVLALLTTPDGKPVAGEVALEVGEDTVQVRTGPNGVGAFTLNPAAPMRGALTATAQVSDATGRRARLSVQLPVMHTGAFIDLDKALVAPGEALKGTVRLAPNLTAPMALELRHEGRLLGRQPLGAPSKDNTFAVALRVPEKVLGSLDVLLVTLDGPAGQVAPDPYFEPDRTDKLDGAKPRRPRLAQPPLPQSRFNFGLMASRRILSADPKGVTVTMAADQTPYQPGATAKLKFQVRDADGKPRAAAIGIAVVDESLFALTTARPALARAFFTLGAQLSLARGPLAAADLTAGAWSEGDQLAAKVLFAGTSPEPAVAQAQASSFHVKQARLEGGKRDFRKLARPGWVVWGTLFGIVLALALSRYARSFVGGLVLLTLATVGMYLGLKTGWVVSGLTAAVLTTLLLYSVSTRRIAWGLIAVTGSAALLMVFLVGGLRSLEPMMSSRAHPASAPVPQSIDGFARDFAESNKAEKKRAMADVEGEPPPAPAAAVAGLVQKPAALGKLTKGGGGAKAEEAQAEPERREVRVRQYFPETLFVHPELVTDEQGLATLEVPIADSITNWRVTALASTADGKLGALEEPLKVFQDFFVDLDTPVALVTGDTATIPIAVHNHLGEAQTVRLEVEQAQGFEVLGPSSFKVTAGAGQLVGQELRVRVTAAGRHMLKVRADGTRLSDVVARELRVFEAGEERSAVVSGTLVPGKAVPVSITLPPSALPSSARLEARFYGSKLASAMKGLEGALAAPHGCFEQTSSTTYPNVLIWKHLQNSGVKDGPAVARARAWVALGYQRLLSYEVPGGGFEWFGRSPANQVLTAYGLLEFRDMAQVFPVDPAVLSRTQDFLVARQARDGGWEPDRTNLSDGLYRSSFSARLNVSAYIAWALAESGFRGPALDRAAAYLAANVDQTNDPYTLALITGTLARAGHASAPAVAAKLEGLAQKDGGKAWFSPTEATVYYSRGTGASAEATALAAQALAAAKTGGATAKGALAWLAANRDARGTWHSTQGTVMALRAILMSERRDADQQVKVSVNGAEALVTSVTATAERAAIVDLAAQVKAGDNVVTLESSGEAPFQVVLTWVQPWREPGANDRDALSLAVGYGRSKAKLGDIVPVDLKLTYRKPEASGMVVASLGVPAGLQPLAEDLEALKRQGRIARYEVNAGSVTLYFDRLAANAPATLELRMKAVAKVTTSGQGSLAYLYYHPEVRAKSPAAAMVVD
jgi:alpha-2-macroglobulin-like protein